MMGPTKLNAEQFLPISMEKAWDFFSSPKNLGVITPPNMHFKILSELPEGDIFEGLLINYTIKPFAGIPFHWQTEIVNVSKNRFFTDKQTKGPFKIWEHTHTFVEVNEGVQMHDEVLYQPGFGIFGSLAHSIFLKQKIEGVFEFRKKTLEKLFNGNNFH